MSTFRRWLVRLMVAACVLLPVATVAAYAWNPFEAASLDPRQRILGIGLYRVPGASMSPTLEPGRIIVLHVGRDAVASIRRGDIVMFVAPHMPEQLWLKRVVAMAGQTVEIRDGLLYIDGRVIEEPFVVPARRQMPYSRTFGPFRVPAGHVFVLGDNRDDSEDGRFWGALPRGNLRGRLP